MSSIPIMWMKAHTGISTENNDFFNNTEFATNHVVES
jgi:hypothetical protein